MRKSSQVIRYMVFFFILCYVYQRTSQGKLVIFPFLFCSGVLVIKSICELFNMTHYAYVLRKVYSIGFWVFYQVFLLYWCYMNIMNKNYQLCIFSIPFWIVDFYMINRIFLKKRKIQMHISFPVIISSFLIGSVLIAGVVMLYIGIRRIYMDRKETQNYITIEAYYKDYDIYSSDEDGVTYQLNYVYIVNGQEYEISTDYGTTYIPDINSERKIKYNPNNPQKALFVGLNQYKILIYIGAFFVLGASVFILVAFMMLGFFDKIKGDIIGLYIGVLFVIVGIGSIALQAEQTMSIIETIISMGLWVLIPFMFIIIGVYQIIRCSFFYTKKYNTSRKPLINQGFFLVQIKFYYEFTTFQDSENIAIQYKRMKQWVSLSAVLRHPLTIKKEMHLASYRRRRTQEQSCSLVVYESSIAFLFFLSRENLWRGGSVYFLWLSSLRTILQMYDRIRVSITSFQD